jgi:putative acetyltransferase
MIRDGIAQLRALGSAGCVVLGNPAYYTRFGFRQHPRLLYPHAPARDFMVMPFGQQVPEGEAAYHPAFDATE